MANTSKLTAICMLTDAVTYRYISEALIYKIDSDIRAIEINYIYQTKLLE